MSSYVLGLSGSPVKDGNTDAFLEHLLSVVKGKGFETESVKLSDLGLRDCIHCNFCMVKQKPDRYCSLDDGAQALFEKVERADILILASPVYFMRQSGYMASFLDRLRVFIYGNVAGGRLKNKVGVSAAVSWLRHGGIETTHLSQIYGFWTLDMIPATVQNCISPMGASAVASPGGSGKFEKDVRLGVTLDEPGLRSGMAIMDRAVELLQLVRR
ncbi:flavodoxin family protein [Geobacter grbiciae]|uniref:flavodoxin family protein n=1 Tax=Geobacter grbiciae TaxID=155042 RepID=UPI001C01C130|nr:flavodoxin family protein [Geobacter grbiciae]MBT1076941.1 flavodoxin family protein [Geobacter grbiciae]